MSFSFPIPHTARYIQTTNIVNATFNAPTLGVYDFGIPANTRQEVLVLDPNSVYLLGRISVGGDIGEEDFLSSVNQTTPPYFRLSRRQRKENIYSRIHPIVQYIDEQEVATWVQSDKGGDAVEISVAGILNQIPATVGKLSIILHISFSIYVVEDRNYLAKYKAALEHSFGKAGMI